MIVLYLNVEEPTFGASTSAVVLVEGDIIKNFIDTSTKTTSYTWDGWGDIKKFIGLTVKDLYLLMSCWFYEYYNHIATPKIKIKEI